MIPLHQLLERFKNLKNTDKIKKENIVEIFSRNKIPAAISQITFSRQTIVVKVPPIIKTEIILKKTELLKQIEEKLGAGAFLEIK